MAGSSWFSFLEGYGRTITPRGRTGSEGAGHGPSPRRRGFLQGGAVGSTQRRQGTAEANDRVRSTPRTAHVRSGQPLTQESLAAAHDRATEELAEPLVHGRCCLLGLTVLELVRAAAWYQGEIPGYTVFGMHFLTTSTDAACVICSLPIFTIGSRGPCVQLGCLGPMLTLVFAMALVDVCSLTAYLVVATPRPLAPGAKSFLDELEAILGIWEFALVASVALQMALCTSCWRIYRHLRMAGLYPPGLDPAKPASRNVSVLEVVCEAEDIELLAEYRCPCEGEVRPLIEEPEFGTSSAFDQVPMGRVVRGDGQPRRQQAKSNGRSRRTFKVVQRPAEEDDNVEDDSIYRPGMLCSAGQVSTAKAVSDYEELDFESAPAVPVFAMSQVTRTPKLYYAGL